MIPKWAIKPLSKVIQAQLYTTFLLKILQNDSIDKA